MVYKTNTTFEFTIYVLRNYWNGDDESTEEEDNKEGYTEEINNKDEEYHNHNFYYDNKPETNEIMIALGQGCSE